MVDSYEKRWGDAHDRGGWWSRRFFRPVLTHSKILGTPFPLAQRGGGTPSPRFPLGVDPWLQHPLCQEKLLILFKLLQSLNLPASHFTVWALAKDRIRQIIADFVISLSLWFMDGHCECGYDRKLTPSYNEWVISLGWNYSIISILGMKTRKPWRILVNTSASRRFACKPWLISAFPVHNPFLKSSSWILRSTTIAPSLSFKSCGHFREK